ncbi:Suppressor of the cold-sensitive snRNP bioproteinsis mutant brr1-1 [Orbilia oligospora]|nr:Suppressor of the cold-sensitive snRNP bioproteinsis mutant brr1-1 [Orbilia oligospora]
MRTNSHNLWFLFLLFEIFIGQTLAIQFRWPWQKEGKQPVIPINSKIGTIDQYVEIYNLLVKPGYQRDKDFRHEVEAALRKVAAPPQALNTYTVGSSFLGCVAFEVTTGRGSRDAVSKVRSKLKKKLSKPVLVFSDVDVLGNHSGFGEHWQRAPWLFPESKSKAVPRDFSNSSGPASGVAMWETSGDPSLDHGLSSPPLQRYLRHRDPKYQQENRRSPADPASAFNLDQAPVVVDWYSGRFPEIRQISQPPGRHEDQRAEFGNLALGFWNYKEEGKGQVVYVLDTGFDYLHQELSNVEFGDRILTGSFPTDEKGGPDIRLNFKLHGNMVTSKIAGKTLGAARQAKIIPVDTLPGRTPSRVDAAIMIIDGFAKIYDHIRGANNRSNCIVNVSLGLGPPYWGELLLLNQVGFGTSGEIREHYRKAMYYILEELNLLPNAILVISAGNELGTEVNDIPADLGAEVEFRNRTVVVGGTDRHGNNLFQKSHFVRVSVQAIGVAIPCGPRGPARGEKVINLRLGLCGSLAGTSLAAPMVSGVLATMLSAGVPIDKVVRHMYSLAYPRVKGGPKVLYNGISTSQWHS